jgi:S1-C subfamily serine protease
MFHSCNQRILRGIIILGSTVLIAACAKENMAQRHIQLAGSGTIIGPLSHNIRTLLEETNRSYITIGVFDRTNSETQEGSVPDEIATSGSGFIIDEAKGLALTAAHVAITQGWKIKARGPDGRLYQGRVLKTAPKKDTALIKFTSTRGLTRVRPAPSACLKRGEAVFSLGKPSKKGDTARIGTIASMSFGRAVNYRGYGYPDAMVVRLKTEKGESGGPLFNQKGQLVGMVVSTVTDNTGRSLGLAHALPLPLLASTICSSSKCSPAWRVHLGKQTRNCPTS